MNDQVLFEGDLQSSAAFSVDKRYRYILRRSWGDFGRLRLQCVDRVVNWIMLNPSTADHEVDDPTVRRCIKFSQDWGFAGLAVTNLFAFRASSPEVLRHRQVEPVGNENDNIIRRVAEFSDAIVCAWGGGGKLYERDKTVLQLLSTFQLKCLGVTKDGYPRHPLYMKGSTEFCEYKGRTT